MISSDEPAERRFQFERDTFAFANELIWEYRFDPATGTVTTLRNYPPPNYAHRCFVLVRSARQFFYHAAFEPSRPRADAQTYRKLMRKVVSRSPRKPSPIAEKVVIPGYDCLRSFSEAQAALLKAECGGAWQSYALRSHWRMVFPISRRHQERMAQQLVRSFGECPAPIVHLVRFPQLTINHGIVLFDFAETESAIRFSAYDPNIPARPAELTYQRAERAFLWPRNHYWAGGRTDVIEVYRGWFY
jgi:hypothetical protein